MNKGLYPRLALLNIRKNARFYIPYLITGVCTVMMFFMILSLATNEGIEEMGRSAYISAMMGFGTIIVGFFSMLFLLYTNSFLIKRRQKEIGLYTVLGMEKKHIAKVLAYETLYTFIISMVLGLFLGLALNKLAYLVLLKLLHFEVTLGFEFNCKAMRITAILFGVIYTLALFKNLHSLRTANPVELLHGGNVGEREPKTRWFLTVLGVVTLGGGYAISVFTQTPLTAFLLFFVAVFLVIVGTYCLFTSGSIAVLKQLRRNEKLYYQAKHFTAISGMLHRMKQNAVGLANICILSTMVLVTLSTTAGLYLGLDDQMHKLYQHEMTFTHRYNEGLSNADILRIAKQTLDAEGIPVENLYTARYLSFAALQQGDFFQTDRNAVGIYSNVNVKNLCFLLVDDYNLEHNTDYALGEGEVLLVTKQDPYAYDTLSVLDEHFAIIEQVEVVKEINLGTNNIASTYILIVKDMATLDRLYEQQAAIYQENASSIRERLAFDIEGDDETKAALFDKIRAALNDDTLVAESRSGVKIEFLAVYGGLFFIGLFLGLLFLLATVLIIYYKQISEGYEDSVRFHIMQKVGMSRSEVRQSIRHQIRTVFFLPLLSACIHTAMAMPLTTKLMSLFRMTNIPLSVLITLVIAAVFAAFYTLVYFLTAKVYYKIVSWEG